MQKYTTSGGSFDFFKELQDFDITQKDDITTCLISGIPFDEETGVILECGHTFNYKSIYNDVVNSKRINQLETTKLDIDEVRCPYCRNVQKNLLPYKKNVILKKTNGVNHIDVKKMIGINPDIKVIFCYDTTCDARNCNDKCYSICFTTDINDDKMKKKYCYQHFKTAYKNYHRRTNPENTETNKDDAFCSLIDALLGTGTENEVISVNTQQTQVSSPVNSNFTLNYMHCKGVYKTGKNAGKQCTCYVPKTLQYCSKHISQKTEHKCKGVYKTGKNAGKQCSCIVKNGSEHCNRHKPT